MTPALVWGLRKVILPDKGAENKGQCLASHLRALHLSHRPQISSSTHSFPRWGLLVPCLLPLPGSSRTVIPSATRGHFHVKIAERFSQNREGAEGTEVWVSHIWTPECLTREEILSWKQVFSSPKKKANQSGKFRHQHETHRQAPDDRSHCTPFLTT